MDVYDGNWRFPTVFFASEYVLFATVYINEMYKGVLAVE